MLTVEPPFYLIRGVTIFRDHEDADQFYFLPGGPQLTSFTLYKYRVAIAADGSDPTRAPGAGMALFEVEVPPPDLTVIEGELASASGRDKPRLAPVLFRSAQVQAIVAATDGDKLISDLFETHAAPLVLPHHTAFALSLTAEGATLMQRAATASTSADGTASSTAIPVGVVYELRFLALTPAVHARVTMNYEEAYNHFSASLGFTYYYVKAALDLDIAWLVEHDFIKIEITEFTDDADAERQRTLVMNLVTARIQRDFFHSGLPQTPDTPGPSGPLASLLNSGTSGSSINSGTAMFVLKAKYEVDNQSKSFELTFDSRTAVELTHVVSGHLASLVEGHDARILTIDTHDDFFSRLDVKVLSVVDFAVLADLRDAVVDLALGEVRNSYALGPQAGGPFTFAAALASPDADQYTYGVTYDFDADQGLGPVRIAAGPFTSRSRVVVIDPQLHFRYRQVRFSLGPLDPLQVPRVHVKVRVPGADPGSPDLATDTFILDTKNAEHVVRVHAEPAAAEPLRIRARPSWEDPHGNLHDGDEAEVTGDAFLVLGPYADVIPLYVSPAVDWTQVSQVVIEVRYEDGDYIIDKTLSFNAQNAAGQHVDLPLLDATKRSYSWRQTVFRLDGTSPQSDFASADGTVLAPPWQKKTTADVHIVWVGAPGDSLGLRVDVWAETPSGDEQQVSAFLRTGVDGEKVVTLPLDSDGKLSYRYQASRISAAGETAVRSATAQSAPLLVVQTG